MKLNNVLLVCLMLLSSFGYSRNLGGKLQVKDILPVAAVTADGNGTAVDLLALHGDVAAVVDVSAPVAGTNPTMDLKLQESDASGSGFTDITGGGFTQVTSSASVQKISLNRNDLKRYVRIVKDIGGTSSPQYLISGKILGINKYSD